MSTKPGRREAYQGQSECPGESQGDVVTAEGEARASNPCFLAAALEYQPQPHARGNLLPTENV